MTGDADRVQWMTAGQVAKRLGVHRSTVHRLSEEDLPFRIQLGDRRRRYDPKDVERLATGQPPSLLAAVADLAGRVEDHEERIARLEES
jgi:predicted DNA-binding transcriptional regulator AlpA